MSSMTLSGFELLSLATAVKDLPMSTIIASGVSTVAALNLAIEAAHTQIANGGTFEIDLASGGTIALGTTALEAINLNVGNVLLIEGDDATINGGGTQRGLFDYTGSLIVSGLTIANTAAIGGAGGAWRGRRSRVGRRIVRRGGRQRDVAGRDIHQRLGRWRRRRWRSWRGRRWRFGRCRRQWPGGQAAVAAVAVVGPAPPPPAVIW